METTLVVVGDDRIDDVGGGRALRCQTTTDTIVTIRDNSSTTPENTV